MFERVVSIQAAPLLRFLIKRAKKCGEEMLAKWKGVLGGAKHHVGFLFNERMQNLPEEVAPALHKAVPPRA